MVEGLRGWASSPKPFRPERSSLMRRPLPLSESLFRIVRQRRDLVALDPGRSIAADYPELVEGQHLAMRRTGAALPFDFGAGFEGFGHGVLLAQNGELIERTFVALGTGNNIYRMSDISSGKSH